MYSFLFFVCLLLIAASLKMYQDAQIIKIVSYKYAYILFVAVIMLLVFISRNIEYSSDSARYYSHFELIRTLGFRDMITLYIWNPNYFFWTLVWIIGRAGLSYHFFCVFINVFSISIYAAGVYKLVKMYQFSNLYILLIAFCSHEFFLYNSNALRQGLAMAFIPFFILWMIRRKYIRVILLCAVAFLAHTSAIVMFLLIPIILITNGRKKLITFFFILCVIAGIYFIQIVEKLHIPLLSDRLAIIASNMSEQNLLFMLFAVVARIWYCATTAKSMSFLYFR